MSIIKECLNCNESFAPDLRDLKRGNGKYCTINCFQIRNKKIRNIAQGIREKFVRGQIEQFPLTEDKDMLEAYTIVRNQICKMRDCVCGQCGQKFKKLEKSMGVARHGIYFCSRKCKDLAQRLGGIKEIQPAHYGTGSGCSGYRLKAFSHYPVKCNKCGWDKTPAVLEVHHIDCNRENNNISNLRVICPTCHEEEHYLSGTGKWRSRN